METNATKKKKLLLIILLVVVIAAAAIIAVFVIQSQSVKKNYAVSIESAEKYFAEQDYDNAILEYEKAIDLNPEEEEAYIGLADVYLEQGDNANAITILNRGYLKTKSASIRTKLDGISIMASTVVEKTTDTETTVDLLTASEGLSWNTSLLQKLSGYTYKEFKQEFGAVSISNKDSDGYVVVTHSNLDAGFYYRNTSSNKNIVNESTGTPYDNAMPEKVVFNDITGLFRNFEGAASVSRIETLLGTKATIRNGNNGAYIDYTIANCELCIGTDDSGNITSADVWNEILLPGGTQASQAGSLSGVVIDAVTGQGVSGASVICTSASDSVTVTTDSNGMFTANLSAGDYTIRIEASGYISEEFSCSLAEGEKKSGEQYTISPSLSGEARIVLEWGASPTDLDSYLDGTTDSGVSIHTSYYNKTVSSGGTVLAELDLDDTSGYGPETTTIHDLDGVYTFSVKDFTGSGTMASQGATVKVYLPGQDVVTITLSSSSGVVNDWSVCKIDHGSLQILNTAGN